MDGDKENTNQDNEQDDEPENMTNDERLWREFGDLLIKDKRTI